VSTGECVHVFLNGLNSAGAERLLATLSDQIRQGKLDQQQIDSQQWWQSWKGILTDTLAVGGKLLQGVSVEVNAGVVKASFSGRDVANDMLSQRGS
jgi:hypothetical protein